MLISSRSIHRFSTTSTSSTTEIIVGPCPTRTCAGSLRVAGSGVSTVPHQPSWPRTTAECTDSIPPSCTKRGGSRTPTRKKDNREHNEGNEHHGTDDPTLHARGSLILPSFLWSPVCHTALLVHESAAYIS